LGFREIVGIGSQVPASAGADAVAFSGASRRSLTHALIDGAAPRL